MSSGATRMMSGRAPRSRRTCPARASRAPAPGRPRRGPERHRLQRLLARHPLLGVPAARRLVVGVLPRHRRVEGDAAGSPPPPGSRSRSGRSRPVSSSERQAYAPSRPRLAQPALGPVHVARLVASPAWTGSRPARRSAGCRRGERICACSTRKRWSAVGAPRQRRLVGVEHDPVGRGRRWRGVHLEAARQRRSATASMCSGGVVTSSPGGWVVAVRIEQRRAARAERAVGVELDRADPERPSYSPLCGPRAK